LIQKHADVKKMIFPEDPVKIAKIWKEEAQKAKKSNQEDVNMEESSDDEAETDKKHRDLFS
jgi:hypothetical protein